MGSDAKTSVTNAYCQLHDVDNVYVVDGSVHVTNEGFNPSLTISGGCVSGVRIYREAALDFWVELEKTRPTTAPTAHRISFSPPSIKCMVTCAVCHFSA